MAGHFIYTHPELLEKRDKIFAFLKGVFLDNPFSNPVLTQAYYAAPDYSSAHSLGLRALEPLPHG